MRDQAQTQQCDHGKVMPLCPFYFRLVKTVNNCLAFCWYEAIPLVFKCQNTEEV